MGVNVDLTEDYMSDCHWVHIQAKTYKGKSLVNCRYTPTKPIAGCAGSLVRRLMISEYAYRDMTLNPWARSHVN